MAVERQTNPNATPTKLSGNGSKFLQEVQTELKKTTWPTRAEALRLTYVVIGVIAVLGVYMGTLDWLLSALFNKFSLLK